MSIAPPDIDGQGLVVPAPGELGPVVVLLQHQDVAVLLVTLVRAVCQQVAALHYVQHCVQQTAF